MRNVVILGMHRSGTSMVAGALVAAGIRAGEGAELLEDQEDNPHGFWERRDVVELNDRSLAGAAMPDVAGHPGGTARHTAGRR